MRVATGKVEKGRVVVEGEPLEEGAIVTVLAPEAGETFSLDLADEDELVARLAEADRGDLVDGSVVLKSLEAPG